MPGHQSIFSSELLFRPQPEHLEGMSSLIPAFDQQEPDEDDEDEEQIQ